MSRLHKVLAAGRGKETGTRRHRGRQHEKRRAAERLVRLSVLAFVRWAARQEMATGAAARRIGLAPSTLASWRDRWRENRLKAKRRGRPLASVDRDLRHSILAVFGLIGPQVGLPTLQGLFPDVRRAVLEDLQRRLRDVFRRRRSWVVHALRWTKAGRVWAADFSEPPAPIEGHFPYLFVVRDLASGCVLMSLPVPGKSSLLVVRLLTSLFTHFGPPLVLKWDNDSVFRTPEIDELLARFGVQALYSPEGTPAYNGSVEAGIGSIKVRAYLEAARHDRPGEWTCDDIKAAMDQANQTGRPHGAENPTPWQAWTSRDPVPASERLVFEESRSRFAEQEYTQRGRLPGTLLPPREEAAVNRLAISRALIERGLLCIRRRRMTPPISVFRSRKRSSQEVCKRLQAAGLRFDLTTRTPSWYFAPSATSGRSSG